MTRKTSPAYRASKEETIPINKLHPFSNHPFHIRHDLEFSELVDSISESGIITPIIVRPKVGVGYEVISGHRRWEACKELGIESIPARVEYIQQIALVMLKIVVCRWAVVHTTEILNALFEVASTVTVGISGYVGSGEVNTTVDIENAIAALPGGIGNMPVALELMVVGWMLRIVNIVVNTIVAARFIELYVYNAMASLSIATLCYQELHGIAVNFLKSYLAVALQGAVLYLVIGFYPALAGSLGTGGSITEQAWAMLGQSVILLVAVFMSGKFTKAITNAMT